MPASHDPDNDVKMEDSNNSRHGANASATAAPHSSSTRVNRTVSPGPPHSEHQEHSEAAPSFHRSQSFEDWERDHDWDEVIMMGPLLQEDWDDGLLFPPDTIPSHDTTSTTCCLSELGGSAAMMVVSSVPSVDNEFLVQSHDDEMMIDDSHGPPGAGAGTSLAESPSASTTAKEGSQSQGKVGNISDSGGESTTKDEQLLPDLYQKRLSGLKASMKRSRESRKSLQMTPSSPTHQISPRRRKTISHVLSQIDHSTYQLDTCYLDPAFWSNMSQPALRRSDTV